MNSLRLGIIAAPLGLAISAYAQNAKPLYDFRMRSPFLFWVASQSKFPYEVDRPHSLIDDFENRRIIPENVVSEWGYRTISASHRSQSAWETKAFGTAQVRVQSIKAVDQVPDWEDAYYRFTIVEERFPSPDLARSRFTRLKENDPEVDPKSHPELVLRDGFVTGDTVLYATTDSTKFEIEAMPFIFASLRMYVLGEVERGRGGSDSAHAAVHSSLLHIESDTSAVSLKQLLELEKLSESITKETSERAIISMLGEPPFKTTGGWGHADRKVWTYLTHTDDSLHRSFSIWFDPETGCSVSKVEVFRSEIEKTPLLSLRGEFIQVTSRNNPEKEDEGFSCLVRFNRFGRDFIIGVAVAELDRVKGTPEIGAAIRMDHYDNKFNFNFRGVAALYLESIVFTADGERGAVDQPPACSE